MNQSDSRKFLGSHFGLSISVPPSDDPGWPPSLGEPNSVVNHFVLNEGSNLLFEGGQLVLGHRWDDLENQGRWADRGVLSHLAAKSHDFRGFRPAFPDQVTGAIPPAILNLLAWPDLPPPETEEKPAQLISEGVLEIRQVRPHGFDEAVLNQATDATAASALLQTPLGRYARVRSLTAMRQELVRATDFRICVGGAFGQPHRRLPGIVEEALLTAVAQKPIYISSAFGGVSKALADCLLQRRIKLEEEQVFFTPEPMVQLMVEHSPHHPYPSEVEGPSTRAGWNALAYFQSLKLETLAAQAGLETAEFIDLLATPDIERAMAWILKGVSTVRASAK